jgi:hypothetical protein
MLRTTAVILATAALAASASTADAQSRPVCYPALTGTATSTGLFGTGTALARAAARADFEQRAASAYGSRYGNFANARRVRWDCKPNALLLAKCAVTAIPCRR